MTDDTPYVEKPDEMETEGTSFCFLDKDRPCSPECVAFIHPPNAQDYESQSWANCHLLVNIHRTGKHLPILADVASNTLKQRRQQIADMQRTGSK